MTGILVVAMLDSVSVLVGFALGMAVAGLVIGVVSIHVIRQALYR